MRPVIDPTEDRALGCFLGLAVGDALGTTLEFSTRDTQPPVTDMVGGGHFGLPPGCWTDDTSMAICLAEIRAPKIVALAAGEWRGKTRDEIHSAGYVVDTLKAALWSVGRTTSFADAVLLAVNLGDDADTVGAAKNGNHAGYLRCH